MIKMFCECLYVFMVTNKQGSKESSARTRRGGASSDGVFIMELDLSRNDGCARCLWSCYVMVTQGKS